MFMCVCGCVLLHGALCGNECQYKCIIMGFCVHCEYIPARRPSAISLKSYCGLSLILSGKKTRNVLSELQNVCFVCKTHALKVVQRPLVNVHCYLFRFLSKQDLISSITYSCSPHYASFVHLTPDPIRYINRVKAQHPSLKQLVISTRGGRVDDSVCPTGMIQFSYIQQQEIYTCPS